MICLMIGGGFILMGGVMIGTARESIVLNAISKNLNDSQDERNKL